MSLQVKPDSPGGTLRRKISSKITKLSQRFRSSSDKDIGSKETSKLGTPPDNWSIPDDWKPPVPPKSPGVILRNKARQREARPSISRPVLENSTVKIVCVDGSDHDSGRKSSLTEFSFNKNSLLPPISVSGSEMFNLDETWAVVTDTVDASSEDSNLTTRELSDSGSTSHSSATDNDDASTKSIAGSSVDNNKRLTLDITPSELERALDEQPDDEQETDTDESEQTNSLGIKSLETTCSNTQLASANAAEHPESFGAPGALLHTDVEKDEVDIYETAAEKEIDLPAHQGHHRGMSSMDTIYIPRLPNLSATEALEARLHQIEQDLVKEKQKIKALALQISLHKSQEATEDLSVRQRFLEYRLALNRLNEVREIELQQLQDQLHSGSHIVSTEGSDVIPTQLGDWSDSGISSSSNTEASVSSEVRSLKRIAGIRMVLPIATVNSEISE